MTTTTETPGTGATPAARHHWIITLQAATPAGVTASTVSGSSGPLRSRREAYDAIVAEAKRLTGLTAPVAVLFFSLEPDEL